MVYLRGDTWRDALQRSKIAWGLQGQKQLLKRHGIQARPTIVFILSVLITLAIIQHIHHGYRGILSLHIWLILICFSFDLILIDCLLYWFVLLFIIMVLYNTKQQSNIQSQSLYTNHNLFAVWILFILYTHGIWYACCCMLQLA